MIEFWKIYRDNFKMCKLHTGKYGYLEIYRDEKQKEYLEYANKRAMLKINNEPLPPFLV